jgi:uncharacterized membrane protein
MATLLDVLTLIAALGAGLVAGIFFAFSSFVMGALGRLPAQGGIVAMQSINVVVLNPVFFAAFFGTAIVSLILAIAVFLDWSTPDGYYLVGGAFLYIVGCLLVTMVCNVPLNNRLATVDPASANGKSVWTHYLSAWTAWNTVRTIASLAASALFILALYDS